MNIGCWANCRQWGGHWRSPMGTHYTNMYRQCKCGASTVLTWILILQREQIISTSLEFLLGNICSFWKAKIILSSCCRQSTFDRCYPKQLDIRTSGLLRTNWSRIVSITQNTHLHTNVPLRTTGKRTPIEKKSVLMGKRAFTEKHSRTMLLTMKQDST